MPDRDAPPPVPDGTPYDEAVSALIKSLRRGREVHAGYWAAQLSVRYSKKAWRLLEVFACEDVGIADPGALPYIVAGRTAWDQAADESRGRLQLVLLIASVLMLARAPKSREADDLTEAVRHLVEDGWRPDVPPEAIDLHTDRGRATIPPDERLARWLTDGSRIQPDSDLLDWRAWIRRWAARRGRLDPAKVEAQIAEWHDQGQLRWGFDGYPIDQDSTT